MDENSNHELTLERVFDAPRDLVYKAWADEELLAKWWGPAGVTIPTCEWDAQPGGKIHIVMLAGPELGELAGQEWPLTGEVVTVNPPSGLTFKGNAIVNDKVVMENVTTVTLEDMGDKTKLTLHVQVTKTSPEAAGPLAGMEMGWSQSLDKLGELVKA